MSIITILKESLEIVKKNPILFVPMLALTVIVALLSLIFLGSMVPFMGGMQQGGTVTSQQAMTAAGAALGGIFITLILSSILGLVAHGMTVAMADEAVQSQSTSLKGGLNKVKERLLPIILAAVLVGLIVSVGFMLLVLPGIIAMFLLMFTFMAVMLDNENAFRAIGKSTRTVTGHFGAVFVLFLVLIALGLLVAIIDAIVGMIPILGVVLSIIFSAAYSSFITVFLVIAYRGFEERDMQKPTAEV